MSFLACFAVSANIFCFYLLCTYIVYILKCGKKTLPKWQKQTSFNSLSMVSSFTFVLYCFAFLSSSFYCYPFLPSSIRIRYVMCSYTFIVSSCNDCWIKMICFDVISLKCFAGVFLHQTRTLIRYYWHVFGKYKYMDMLSVFCTSAKNNHCFLYEILNN